MSIIQPKTDKAVADGGESNESGLDHESIQIVIDQTLCTREKVVKMLRKTNGDIITAIMVSNHLKSLLI